jgi:hypothetical protein
MRRLFMIGLASILFAASVAVARQADASVAGSWDITVESPQGKRTSILVIKQEGGKLVGTMKSQRGERPLDSISVKGNEITMAITIPFQGSDMKITYTGKVEKDSMKGEADFGGLASGEWSAVPHKEGTPTAAAPATPATGAATPAPATPATGTAAPAPASAANLSGVWKFDVTLEDGGKGDPTFTFKQEGETLTGNYKGPLGEAPVTGTIKNGEAKFSIKVAFQGEEVVVNYAGKLAGADSMTGTMEIVGRAKGNWTAKKQ